MKKLALGTAALLSSIGMASGAAAATVDLFFAGQFTYQATYGSQGDALKNYIGCSSVCDWQLTLTLPDIAGPEFATQAANLYLNGTDYAISGRLISEYHADFPYDILNFVGDGLAVPVPGMVGDEVLYFNFMLNMPLGTFVGTHETPPTDPNLYLNHLLPGSSVNAALRNFPGTPNGESGVNLQSYDPRFPEYPLNDFIATGSFSAAAVPEPASWMTMIGGFALAGATMRRRKAGQPAGSLMGPAGVKPKVFRSVPGRS